MKRKSHPVSVYCVNRQIPRETIGSALFTSLNIFSWFFGPITPIVACAFLEGQPQGTFLIRNSSSSDDYALSMMLGGRIRHFKIIRQNRLYILTLLEQSYSFESLEKLVETYSSSSMISTRDGCTSRLLSSPRIQSWLRLGGHVTAGKTAPL
ncbi:Cytoplasmic protein NCK2 [Planoprotostelium fungivorum]|uniref:Cytoplasmic protein NCK2 n=1 Tax=Planoprotostelium fungivorum TaxID=1890364 RepID=A0A2P6NH61_9EUKA|nr:Cytoplasmic protein NCK2 [Planoprotostelium fungivorum]PRP83300.1 Cytoplasmic protein NCK2 [Planoprotostelium fungivorum]